MATLRTPQSKNHLTNSLRSWVKAPKRRTDFSARSGGTAAQISLAPRSTPPASGWGSWSGLVALDLVFALLCFFIGLLVANEGGLAQTAKTRGILVNGVQRALMCLRPPLKRSQRL